MTLESKNPATGEIVARFSSLSESEIDHRITTAAEAFETWKARGPEDRSRLLRSMASWLRRRQHELATLATLEMGKTLASSLAEVEKCAWVFDYYADEGPSFLEREIVDTDATKSYVRFDPLGLLLAVMPWNFPYWQVMRFAAPALLAGNVALLKHASNVPQCAQAIEDCFLAAGFPEGVFQNLAIKAEQVERVLENPLLRAASLTGSESAGASVAGFCGSQIKRTVLELGGSDPFIVLADADLDAAVEGAVASRFQANGQSCIAAKRFILVRDVASVFLEKFRERVEALKLGDPMDEETDIGPLATEQIVAETEAQVEASVALGARVVTGGRRDPRPGFFFMPTILDGVKRGMPAYEEEVFGPVAACLLVENEEEAIAVANDTRFGLGASIWSADTERAESLASEIQAGSVFVNGMVKSDPRLPFGGVGISGYGRELSRYGLMEMVNIKTVWVR